MEKPILSSVLQPLHDAALLSFVQVLKQDSNATVFRNLLDTVQEICKFVAALALAMIQAYVEVRLQQAAATQASSSRAA